MSTGKRTRGGRGSVVPDAEIRTYYDRPVLKQPVWTWEIPWYFFSGGLAGASSMLAFAAARRGDTHPARTWRRLALGGAVASPALLISDLGRPERFVNMLRVFRPTSPMSMGSWLLAAFGPLAAASAALAELDRFPRAQTLASLGSAVLGPAMATYTAVLTANTAIPVWHEARQELPFVFAASSLTTAGAAAALTLPPGQSALARRAAVVGAVAEGAATQLMEHRLDHLARPYREGRAGRLARTAQVLTTLGASAVALFGRRRPVVVAGSVMLLVGAACQRWAIFRAGFQSAADPRFTVESQRV